MKPDIGSNKMDDWFSELLANSKIKKSFEIIDERAGSKSQPFYEIYIGYALPS
jgi:hypothetical protein